MSGKLKSNKDLENLRNIQSRLENLESLNNLMKRTLCIILLENGGKTIHDNYPDLTNIDLSNVGFNFGGTYTEVRVNVGGFNTKQATSWDDIKKLQ